MDLPVIRSGERKDYKRCVKKWYWTWRKGLVPKAVRFGPLELGTWMHAALAAWYGSGYVRDRENSLAELFAGEAAVALEKAVDAGAPEHVLDKAEELAALGEAMAEAYEAQYGQDEEINVIASELPLEFSFPDPDTGKIIAVHKLKPDLVFATGYDVWLMEHKTASQVRTEHLVIDDQARPYGAMAERSMRKLGIIGKRHKFRGILYNFLRKGLPDERLQNAQGKYLNLNGQVSKRQPPPLFVRKPVLLTDRAKRITLLRIQSEAVTITKMTMMLRKEPHLAKYLPKTPHNSCPRTCQFFDMCVSEEEGTDTRLMERSMYTVKNPYLYEEETTDELPGFEMG